MRDREGDSGKESKREMELVRGRGTLRQREIEQESYLRRKRGRN